MKQTIASTLLVLTAVASWASLDARTASAAASAAKTRYGIELGFDMANAATAPDPNAVTTTQGTHLGFNGGFYLDYELTSLFYFSPEVLFLQKGASLNNVTANLNYLAFPLLLKAKLDFGRVKPFLFTGPELDFLLNASRSNGNVTVTANNFNTLDFAWDIGAGLEYEFTSDVSFQGNVRYSTGVIDVDGAPSRWYARDVQVMFGASVAL